MQWESEVVEQPEPKFDFRSGPLFLCVEGHDDDTRWNYLSLSFGEFSTQSMEECLENWPWRAIELARNALNAFEESLEE